MKKKSGKRSVSAVSKSKKKVFKHKAVSRKSSAPRRRSPEPSTNFPTPQPVPSWQEAQVWSDLPFSYGETRLVLMVRDPYWAYSYWDFSGETWNQVQSRLARDTSFKPVMRIHDLDAKRFFDLLISLEAKNWYLHLGTPDHRYVAELGVGDGHSRFYLIVRSNEVRTPRDTPSDVTDPEWEGRDFDELYRLSGGGQSGLSSLSSFFLPRQA